MENVQIRELQVIIDINHQIIKSLDHKKVLQVISNGMSDLLDIETAAIYLRESEDTIRLAVTTPPLPDDMPEKLLLASLNDHPYINKTINSGEPICVVDTLKEELTAEEKLVVEIRNLRSLLYFPFVLGEDVLGVLILGTCFQTREFSKHEIDLGQTIANQLAVAISNSRLYNDLKEHKLNLEKMVVERTYELEATNEELHSINDELVRKNEIITKQKEALELALKNLKETQLQLIESEKMASLGVLTAGVAHEINNPLNFISTASDALEIFFSEHNLIELEEPRIMLDSIKTGIRRASEIIQGLNQFSRNNSNHHEICNIPDIIDNCLVMLQNQLKYKIELQKDYCCNDLDIKGNVGKLHQAFINILTNAIKAIGEKGFIKIGIRKEMENVIIDIKDNGCGIPENIISKITEPFFTTNQPGEGTGLGLSITYSIIKDHHGTLKFKSVLNQGTTVLVTLPINR